MDKILDRIKVNDLLAFFLLAVILTIVSVIVFNQIGGANMTYLIVGHLLAWGEMIVLFYYRKKQEPKKP